MGRRERRTAAIRQALLDGALKVMSVKGLHLTRIEDITEAADVAKGSFYAHFKDKDDILASTVENIIAEISAVTDAEVVARMPLQQRIATFVRAQIEYFEANRGRLMVIHQARGLLLQDAAGYPAVRLAVEKYNDLIETMVRGSREGDPSVYRHAAYVLAGIVWGYSAFANISEGPRADVSAVAEAAARASAGMLGND